MVEAVWPAIRADVGLRRYYEGLRIKKGANCAKVATAKRLLTIVYRVLKENRYYEVRRLPTPWLCPDLSGLEPFKESGGRGTEPIWCVLNPDLGWHGLEDGLRTEIMTKRKVCASNQMIT